MKIKFSGEKVTRLKRKYVGNFLQRVFKFGPFEFAKEEIESNKVLHLNANVLVYDRDKKLLDAAYPEDPESEDGSIHCLEANNDNERIVNLDFDKISKKAMYVVVIMNSSVEQPTSFYTVEIGNEKYYINGNHGKGVILGVFRRSDDGKFIFKVDGTMITENSLNAIERSCIRKIL